jgi:SulP family sulfate permease
VQSLREHNGASARLPPEWVNMHAPPAGIDSSALQGAAAPLPKPRAGNVVNDLWGGIAAMLVALPSAIAFGVVIFAPLGGELKPQGAVAGMLGAVVLGIVAPLLGGSTRLISAPCAPAAAVLGTLAAGFAQSGMAAPQVLMLLGLIGLLAGLIQVLLGLATIGKLIKFIPFPVVSGYLTGVGLIIIGSQIPKLLGLPGETQFLVVWSQHAAWVWQSALIGAVVIAFMLLSPKVSQVVPAAITALLSGLACYGVLAAMGLVTWRAEGNPLLIGPLTGKGGSLLGTLGMPWPTLAQLTPDTLVQVLVPALTLAVLLSIDTLKTCVVIDALTITHHNANRELMGQGVSNALSSLLGGIPGAGTMGASMINISSGGTTRLSGLFSGIAALAVLLVLAPLVAWVPLAALAGILIVTGFRMIDRRSLAFFYTSTTRLDFVVILSVILVALFGSLIAASGVGVALAILLYIREQTRVSVVRHRIEGQDLFAHRPALTHSQVGTEVTGHDAVVFELQGNLFFGTASQLQRALEPETGARKYVILNMRRVQSLDVTATHVLEQIKDRLEEHNAYLVFCDIPKGLPSGLKMKRFLKDTGVVRPTNKAFAFRQLEDVLRWLENKEQPLPLVEARATDTVNLRDMPWLGSCTVSDRAALEAQVQMQRVAAGKKLFKHGLADEFLYFVHSGQIKLGVHRHKKDILHLPNAMPGQLLCDLRYFQPALQGLDAQALTDTEVYTLSKVAFAQLANDHSTVATAVSAALNSYLSDLLIQAVAELQESAH